MLNLIKNQACNENSYISFLLRVKEILRKLSKSKRFLLNNLAYFDQKYRIAAPSQTKLGYYSGIGREHTNRCIQEFKELDLITSQFRYKTTSIYKLNPLFYYPEIAHALKHLLPNLVLSLILTLAFSPAAAFQKNVTLIKVKVNPSVINSYLTRRIPLGEGHVTKRIVKQPTSKRMIGAPLGHQLQNGWNEEFKKYVRGIKRVNETISPGIQAIKSISLTLRGQIEFMPYPDFIIQKADEAIQKVSTPISDPAIYMRKLCRNFCAKENITPNWGIITELLAYHKIDNDSPLMENKIINRVPISSFKQTCPTKYKFHKQEGSRRSQEWKGHDNRKYGPAKVTFYDYADVTPEEKAKVEIRKKHHDEMHARWEKRKEKVNQPETANDFNVGCKIDHNYELSQFLSPFGVQELEKLCMIIGKEKAYEKAKHVIRTHNDCLSTNHGGA